MKVAKNNPKVIVNTNSEVWKYVIFNPNRLDLIITKAKTLERAEKSNRWRKDEGWIIDELVFPNEITNDEAENISTSKSEEPQINREKAVKAAKQKTLAECKEDYVIVQDKMGRRKKVKRGKEFIQYMIKHG